MQSFLLNALILSVSFSSLVSACIYKRAAGSADWSYTGENGPILWHQLNSTNKACAEGKEQSPINVDTSAHSTKQIELNYPTWGEFKIENNGHTIQLTPHDQNSYFLKFNGSSGYYKLLQFHFHTPSEHRLNQEHFPLEVHFVHQHVSTGALAVVGVFFDITSGPGDRFLTGISLDNMTATTQDSDERQYRGVYLPSISKVAESSTVNTYAGSLTTPPCSEAVSWFVVQEPLTVSVDQYNKFKKIMKFNSRFTQNEVHSDNLVQEACRS